MVESVAFGKKISSSATSVPNASTIDNLEGKENNSTNSAVIVRFFIVIYTFFYFMSSEAFCAM